VAGEHVEGSGAMTDQRWQRIIIRIMDEAFEDYETGLVTLRKHVVLDLKHKLTDSRILDRPLVEESLPREQPAAAGRHPRSTGRRPRG
jgi:hypothetical protein